MLSNEQLEVFKKIVDTATQIDKLSEELDSMHRKAFGLSGYGLTITNISGSESAQMDMMRRMCEGSDEGKAEYAEKSPAIKIELERLKPILEELYSVHRIIPLPYRKAEAMQYIYNIVSTSDYEMKDAIEMYDRYAQRKENQERFEEQKEDEKNERKLREYKEAKSREEQQQYYQESIYHDTPSSSDGGGFFDGLLSGVVAGAVGGRVARGKENNGSGRQNLFGSAICVIGKDSKGGYGRIVTCSYFECAAYNKCTQQGKYNAGDY